LDSSEPENQLLFNSACYLPEGMQRSPVDEHRRRPYDSPTMSERENDPAAYELTAGDAAFVVAVLDHLAALAVARPGLALTDEQRLFLSDNSIAGDRHQMADRLSKVAAAIKEQLPADAPEG
jgi:hypothetical protein